MSEIQGGIKPQSTIHPVPRRASLYAYGFHKLGGARAGVNKYFIVTHGAINFGDPAKVRSDLVLGRASTGAFPTPYLDKRGSTLNVNEWPRNLKGFRDVLKKVLWLDDDYKPKDLPLLQPKAQLDQSLMSWDPLDQAKDSSVVQLFDFCKDKLPLEMKLRRDSEERIIDHIKDKFQGRGCYIFETQEATRIVNAEFTMKQATQLFTRFFDDFLDMKPIETHWGLVGLGQFTAAPKLTKKRVPSMWIEWMNGAFNAQIRIAARTKSIKNQFWYYAHLELLATAIRSLELFDDSMTDDDYLALAWWFVYQQWGTTGTNKMPDTISDATSESLYQSIIAHMFNNTNQMWKYEIGSVEEFIRYFIFEFIKAFVCLRIKPEQLDLVITRVKGAPLDSLHYFVASNTPDYRSFGSQSLWLIPSRNAPGVELQLPCSVDQDNDKSFSNKLTLYDETVGDTFSTITLVNKQYPAGTFDPMDSKEIHLNVDLSQPESVVEVIQLKRRNAMIWKWPKFLGLGLSDIPDAYRRRDWLLSYMSCAGTVFQNGIQMNMVPDLVREPSWHHVFENMALLQGKNQPVDTTIGKEGTKAVEPPVVIAETEKTTPATIPEKTQPPMQSNTNTQILPNKDEAVE